MHGDGARRVAGGLPWLRQLPFGERGGDDRIGLPALLGCARGTSGCGGRLRAPRGARLVRCPDASSRLPALVRVDVLEPWRLRVAVPCVVRRSRPLLRRNPNPSPKTNPKPNLNPNPNPNPNPAAAWRLHAERQPLAFIDRSLFAHIVESQRQLAAVVGASPRDLALLPNATSALSVAISAACDAADVHEGDEILLLDVGYGSVSKMAARECKRRGASMVTLPLLSDLPSSAEPEALLGRFQEAVGTRTKVAIFDHVTSNTAMQLPVSELAATCRARGVVSVVDGAHSLGCTRSLDVQAVGADYFCGNLHKWLCNVRGSGFLVLRPNDSKLRSATEPLVASHGYGGGFTSDFIWQGASDYSPWLAVPSCLEWWRSVGGIDRAVERNHALLVGACELLAAEWQTQPLLSAGSSLSMALVELPLPRRDARGNSRVYASRDGKEMQDALFHRNIECPIKTVNGRLYARISAAVYNELDEYERLAHAVQAITLRGMQ